MGIFPPRSVIEIADIMVGMGVNAYVGARFTDSGFTGADMNSKTAFLRPRCLQSLFKIAKGEKV